MKFWKMIKFWKIFDFWNFFIDLYNDARLVRIVKNAYKEDITRKLLSEYQYELRINTLTGALYTIIPIPEDFYGDVKIRESYMITELQKINDILLKVDLADILTPEYEYISGTPTVLVILSPDTNVITTNIGHLAQDIFWMLSKSLVFLLMLRFAYLGIESIDPDFVFIRSIFSKIF